MFDNILIGLKMHFMKLLVFLVFRYAETALGQITVTAALNTSQVHCCVPVSYNDVSRTAQEDSEDIANSEIMLAQI